MKKNKAFLIILIIILLILGAWYLVSSFSNGGSQENTEANLNFQETEPFMEQKSNCEVEGGMWLVDRNFCHIYNQEQANLLQESCEELEGEWLVESEKYECIIDGELWQYGEWEMLDWQMFMANKESCLDSGGAWLGGLEEACEINGDTFYRGQWLVLEEMENLCVNEYSGEWLGGEDLACKIDGEVYPGNFVSVFEMKASCEENKGTWLGGDNNECQISSEIYENKSWERIEEMKTSCEEAGGVYVGGNKFSCDINDVVYDNKLWERVSKADVMGQRCEDDGGNWEVETKTCSGLALEWCMDINEELEFNGLGWRESDLSCYVY